MRDIGNGERDKKEEEENDTDLLTYWLTDLMTDLLT